MSATGNKSYHPLSISIRIFADGFSFFVCDAQSGALVRGEHFRLDDKAALAGRLTQELCRPDYFNHQIDQCYVLLCTPSTRVPVEEFRRDEAAALFEFTFSDVDLSRLRVGYNILPQLESVELFGIPLDVEEAVLQFYPTARFFGARSMLLERLLRIEGDAPADVRRLYVCADAGGADLIAFASGHLGFANRFDYATQADALYFILNTWQLLHLDAERDRLVLICDPSGAAGLKEALAEYVLHVDTLTPPDLFPRVPLAREKQVPLDLMALLLNRI